MRTINTNSNSSSPALQVFRKPIGLHWVEKSPRTQRVYLLCGRTATLSSRGEEQERVKAGSWQVYSRFFVPPLCLICKYSGLQRTQQDKAMLGAVMAAVPKSLSSSLAAAHWDLKGGRRRAHGITAPSPKSSFALSL